MEQPEDSTGARGPTRAQRTDPLGRVIAHYTATFERIYATKCPFTSRDAGAAKKILEARGSPEQAMSLISAAFGEDWWVERGLTICVVASNLARFVAIESRPAPKPKLSTSQQSLLTLLHEEADGVERADPYEAMNNAASRSNRVPHDELAKRLPDTTGGE